MSGVYNCQGTNRTMACVSHLRKQAYLGEQYTSACHQRCVPPHYQEAELTKAESVCLAWCVSKDLDIHEQMGKRWQSRLCRRKRLQQSSGPT